MQDYTVFVDRTTDELQPDASPSFQIAICPFNLGVSAMAVKEYPTEAALAIDLRRFFGFTDVSIEAYFAQQELHQALVHPLSDEVAAYFGWK
jgi:hypothetical protein